MSCCKTRAETEFKGVIKGIPIHDDLDFIRQALSPQKVINIRRIQSKSPTDQLVDTNRLELTFSCPPPHSVYLAGDSFVIFPHDRNPMQCSKCFRIGHLSSHCVFNSRCKSCGDPPHDDAACKSTVRCINCDATDHRTGSPICPKYQENKAILKLATEKCITFPEARRLFSLPSNTPSSFTPPSQPSPPSEVDALKERLRALEEKVSKLSADITPLFSLQDQMKEWVVGFISPIANNIEKLLPMGPAVISLQENFASLRQQLESGSFVSAPSPSTFEGTPPFLNSQPLLPNSSDPTMTFDEY